MVIKTRFHQNPRKRSGKKMRVQRQKIVKKSNKEEGSRPKNSGRKSYKQ